MKYDCDVIRDLLPLYADKACSEQSRHIVEEHLSECPDCRNMVSMLLKTDIEDTLHREEESVIEYGVRCFKRRSAAVGSAVSGSILIPVLICLCLFFRPALSWVSVVIAACCVPAALIAVPLLVRKDKAFWAFCAFCVSLVLLFGVTCLYTGGNWFWIASSASLFGLSVIFLPFVIKAGPVRKLIGESNRVLIVLGIDVALFFNMLNMVSAGGKLTMNSLFFTIGIIAGVAGVVAALIRNRKTD